VLSWIFEIPCVCEENEREREATTLVIRQLCVEHGSCFSFVLVRLAELKIWARSIALADSSARALLLLHPIHSILSLDEKFTLNLSRGGAWLLLHHGGF
jgi:hypothetical protein